MKAHFLFNNFSLGLVNGLAKTCFWFKKLSHALLHSFVNFENDDNFKAGLEDFLGGGEVPERVLLMTTDPLFHLLAESKKISVDGTFRIAPSYWKQVFILQVCSKDKVVYFALMDILQKKYPLDVLARAL